LELIYFLPLQLVLLNKGIEFVKVLRNVPKRNCSELIAKHQRFFDSAVPQSSNLKNLVFEARQRASEVWFFEHQLVLKDAASNLVEVLIAI